MPLSAIFANDLVKLILTGVPIATIADNAALSPVGTYYFSMHTGDPGAAGDQSSNELAYTGYGRMPIVRNASAWDITGNVIKPKAAIEFAEMLTGAGGLVKWVGIGTAATGGGKMLIRGPLTPNIDVVPGVTPRIKAGSSITFLTA
jgi:hypothetical protein